MTVVVQDVTASSVASSQADIGLPGINGVSEVADSGAGGDAQAVVFFALVWGSIARAIH